MKSPWSWYVYIVECADGLYYTGLTWNLEQRIEQHRVGRGSRFTARHGFKELRWAERFENLYDARCCERRVKDYSRKKKERLWQQSFR